MKVKMINIVIALLITPIGIYLVYVFGSWQLLLGIFLLMWANNISQK